MAMDGPALARARQTLAKTKEANEAAWNARRTAAYAAAPELRDIDRQRRALLRRMIQLSVSRQAGADSALADIERESQALFAREAEVLQANGFAPDWLDETASCPKCGDSGYLPDGRMCTCLRALYDAELTCALSSVLIVGSGSFDDFSLDYYEGEARQCMELTLAAARAFADGFGPASPNLLFQGGTGLGKTLLSGCIAKAVAARGFSVVYETAQRAFGAFEEQKFSRDPDAYAEASQKVQRILGCELLVLDDLGTELTTSFTQSALYNVVDTRLRTGKKTVISTNLTDAELAARYAAQAVSRLNGEFETLLFLGRDVRAIKKERRFG